MLLFRVKRQSTVIRKGIEHMDSNPAHSRPHLMEKSQLDRLIRELGAAISHEYPGVSPDRLVFIGIQRSGVPLAERLAKYIEESSSIRYPVGTLDTAMYRDDIGMCKTLPQIFESHIPFDLNNKIIILVDDILQSGRSIRAALDAITYYGRPAVVRLAVLFDRGMREFPIQGDYVGRNYDLPADQRLRISWSEFSGEDDYVYSIPITSEKGA